MSTSKSPERLVFFTDAVVAIALTLLVLPLTEVVGEVVAGGGAPTEVITHHQWQIYSFLLSFAVIARQWLGHHRLFELVKAYNGALMALNFGWLLTIVVLPFPTLMVAGFRTNTFTVLCYIGTILACSVLQTAMVLVIRRDANVAKTPHVVSDRRLANAVASTAALAVAMLLAAVVPGVDYFALLLLLPVPALVRRWSDDTGDTPG
jgi:uncharacterized membrane protein